jgi:hypothetical protein
MEETQAPGLRWRVTRTSRTPIWRATRSAIKAGYPVKSVNLAPLEERGEALGAPSVAPITDRFFRSIHRV